MLRSESDELCFVRVGAARNTARHVLKKAKITKPPVRINDLVSVLEADHGVIIKPWLLADHVSGFLLEEKGLAAIAYNSEHHVHRQRFTVAHEIGHLLLGHNHCGGEGRELSANEKEAQIFAAELLMPLSFLKKDLQGTSCDISVLAKRYWVSKSAMSWRIQDRDVLKYI